MPLVLAAVTDCVATSKYIAGSLFAEPESKVPRTGMSEFGREPLIFESFPGGSRRPRVSKMGSAVADGKVMPEQTQTPDDVYAFAEDPVRRLVKRMRTAADRSRSPPDLPVPRANRTENGARH